MVLENVIDYMKRQAIIDHLEDLQRKVDKMGFKGQNEYDLHLREEIADWLLRQFAVSGRSELLLAFWDWYCKEDNVDNKYTANEMINAFLASNSH